MWMVKEPVEFWVEFWVVYSSCESLPIPQKAPLIPLRRLPWHCRASSKCGITTGWAVSALQEPWSIPSSWRQHDIIAQASQSSSVNLREIFSVRFGYSMSYSSDKTNRPLLCVHWDISLCTLWDKIFFPVQLQSAIKTNRLLVERITEDEQKVF